MTAVLERPVADVAPWRRLVVRSVLLPAAVLAPLTTLALSGDHRFNVYWHGSTVVARPWALVTANLRTVPMYLDFGNFRPLGRMLEWTVDLGAYVLMAVLHLPAEIALRVVAAVAAAVLTGATAVFAEAVTARGRMFAAPPPVPVALLPLALAGCLVAAGPLSTTVLFGGLYYLSAAVVLVVAAWIARGPRRLWPVLLVGAALAAFNEVGALALPLATVAVAVRAWLLSTNTERLADSERSADSDRLADSEGLADSERPADLRRAGDVPRARLWMGGRNCRTQAVDSAHPVTGRGRRWRDYYPALRPVAGLWIGFLPVFLPIRALIFLACRSGDCYRASDVALGPAAATALPDRLTAWLPPIQWIAALHGAGTPGRLIALAALLVFAVVATRTLADLRHLPALDRPQAIALAITGATILLLGAALGSASPQAQSAHWGYGWRDSGLTATGGALLTVALLAGPLIGRFAAIALTLAAAASTIANQAYAVQANQRPDSRVNNAIAASIAQFDDSNAGAAHRCALEAEFAALYPNPEYSRFARGELPGTHSPTDRLEVTASMATEQMYGRKFC